MRKRTKAALVGLLAAALPAVGVTVAHAVDGPHDATVILDGAEPDYDGITRAWPGDEDKNPATAVSERDGKPCWQTSGTPYNRYLYVNVADDLVPADAKRAVVTVEYHDAGAVDMGIQYDATNSQWQGSATHRLTGTGAWRTHQFELTDIRFENRSNGADFRLDVRAGATSMPNICVSRINVDFTDLPLLDVTNRALLFTQGTNKITFATAADTVDWTVGDPGGVPLRSGSAPASADGTAALDISDLGPGYYTLTATANSGAPVTRRTSFGILTPTPTGALSPDNYFAVAIHYGHQAGHEDALLDAMAKVGWGTVRSDANWSAIEKTAGQYNFPVYAFDPGARAAHDRGITSMPILGYRNPLYDGGRTPSTPAGLDAFARFGAATAKNYAGITNDISVYNEYNSTGFNNGACGITATCYLDMLTRSYQQIRAANPNANVVAATSAGTQLPWHQDFVARGGLKYLNTFSVNFYGYASAGPNTIPENTVLTTEFPALVNLVKQHQGDRDIPIWVTENGWPTHTQGSTEPQQADNLIRAQVMAKAAGADKYFWYDVLDDGDNAAEREHRFGLFRRAAATGVTGIAPKAGAVSNAVLIREVIGKQQQPRENLGDAGAYSYPYTAGSTTTRVMWAPQPRTVTLRTTQNLKLTNQFGATTTLRPVNGAVVLDLDASPVFVTGAVSRIVPGGTGLTMTVPEQSITGEPLPVTVKADRTGHNNLPARLTVDVDGVRTHLVTRPGTVTEATVELPATTVTGDRDLTATVSAHRDSALGRLRASTDVVPRFTVTGRPAVTSGADGRQLNLAITNNHPTRTLTPSAIAWQIGGWRGTVAQAPEIPPRSSGTVTVDLAGPEPFTSYGYSVNLTADGHTATDSGTLSYSPIEPDGATTLAPVDLNQKGRWLALRGGTRTGPADLGGAIRYTHTDQALVLTAAITDDVHVADRPADLAWQADSIQYDLYSAAPADPTGVRVEVGAALTPNGPVNYRWTPPPGHQAGPIPGATTEITRDDTQGTTTYTLSVPWPALGLDGPPDGLIGLSFLVNDADTAVNSDARAGYLEWGSGVGGAPKNPTLFHTAQLVG